MSTKDLPTAMSRLDKVPGLNLYIGGAFTLRAKTAMKEANITHILSVLDFDPKDELVAGYKHMIIDIDDVEDENMLQHFKTTNDFIEKGINGGGGVLVHCAMGKSRSATVCVAYIMHHFRHSPEDALALLKKARPIVEPNDGFMQQLDLYARMNMAEDVESEPSYQRWMYQREVQSSAECGQAPEVEKIRFEDEFVADGDDQGDVEYKCRKCRTKLADSKFLIGHAQPPHNEPFPQTLTCAHYFIDPLSWMRPELEKGLLEGRLNCPKCNSNVGKYAWQGMKCSCGAWMVPAISIAKAKVDEMRIKSSVDGVGIRRGPGVASMPATRAGGRGLL